jgi:hypothetical protein
MKKLCAIALLALFTVTMATAQVGRGNTPQADNRVRKALTEAGVDFEVDSDADFKIELECKNNRTQVVWIKSKPMEYELFEVREVFGVSYKAANPPDGSVLLDLMLQNGSRKIGSWQLEKWGSDYVVIFSIRVSADASGKELKSLVELVKNETDPMEIKLTDGKDDW